MSFQTSLTNGRGKAICPWVSCLAALCLFPSVKGSAQQPQAPPPPSAASADAETPLPDDWAPDLLYAILSSPNTEASDALYRAAFAAGPSISSQLEVALKDDRTAEFAAQSLAFIGGEQALNLLSKLVSDPRDLDLRRFFYGALGESQTPQADKVLFDVLNRSDAEPDRTVTEAAILALTVRSDTNLIPQIEQVKKRVRDVVIQDDLENAVAVIEERAKYLATPDGKKSGHSLEEAVRTYFIPALQPPPRPAASKAASRPSQPEMPQPKVSVLNVTLSPDKTRALCRVIFEDPSASAQYDIVLQKKFGDWTVASVWLGVEKEKPSSLPRPEPESPL